MIDKLTIAVVSMDTMKSFYSAVLNLDFEPVELGGHDLQTGIVDGLEILLCPRSLAGVVAETNTVQVRFLVPDVEAAFVAGVGAAGSVLNEPFMTSGLWQAALRDPDGNSLELKQRAAPAS
jgi:predicted enzyme related to lactoylglutathione lyase